jgi:rubrerythrin
MVRYFGTNDPTTRILVEELLRKEEEHASDLSDLLYIANPETGQSEGQDPGTDPLQLQREVSDKTRERTEEELKKGRKPAA